MPSIIHKNFQNKSGTWFVGVLMVVSDSYTTNSAMFYFPNARRPDFSNIGRMDYDEYWKTRGFALNKKLKEREKIILDLVPAGSRVADLGCGNSLLPVKLKEKGCK
ncbi:methionine biosynthesis protein MetW, partial [bacterium]|nr:methionine biosynthesis protein MetW [bacterium]